jgi:TonB-linked SusC/RagA family outer membrane protein
LLKGALLAALLALAPAWTPPLAAQAGTVAGRVTDQDTQRPLVGVQVSAEGTSLRTTTDADGRYTLRGLPSGTYTLSAQIIGYAPAERSRVAVAAAGATGIDFVLRASALAIEGIVVTGVVDPIAGVRTPFTVGRVGREQLQVPVTGKSAVSAIQGKVAGVSINSGSGQPGTGVDIILRTPTTIQKNDGPMIVMDGVILGETVEATSVDFSSPDIESIEVVKGAAAASLYGSRAARGVIAITTSRGKNVQEGRTQITARSEFGTNQLNRGVPIASHHYFLTNAAGQFVNAAGQVVERSGRVIKADRVMDAAYRPGTTFDHIDAFYDPGQFYTGSVSVAQNTRSTNFLVAATRTREPGVLLTNEGMSRNDVRLNLDHRLRDNLSFGVSAFHMRSHRDDLSGTAFQDLLLLPPDVNLLVRDSTGAFVNQPDPTLNLENPIWRQTSRDNYTDRMRTTANINARFAAFSWLRFDGDFSYDRSDRFEQQYVPKGTPVVAGDPSTGSLYYEEDQITAINASASASLLRDIGRLNTRTTLRALIERERNPYVEVTGTNLIVRDVPRLDKARDQDIDSYLQDIRSTGYFLNTGLDYDGKLIFDGLVRRDGSSLFGPNERWQTYYRASAAYRVSQESWWPVSGLDEFKLRYSIGTAGGRPTFDDQYETYSVDASGQISKANGGNANLRPEHTTEQEFGIDAVIASRLSVQLTYARQVTTDQIIQTPQPAVTGFFNAWTNAGTITGNTLEATVEAQILNTANTAWSMTLVADRNRNKITEWNRTCFISSNTISYYCGNEVRGIMYGQRFLRDAAQLPASAQGFRDQFAVNDDGWLVPVGAGGRWQDRKFGTTVNIGGVNYAWGTPVTLKNAAGGDSIVRVGDSNPAFRLGLGNNFRWRGISLYGLLSAQLDGDVYNSTRQRMYQNFRHGDIDQTGKAEEQKKPIDYYFSLYRGNNTSNAFVEDASYLKLRELSLKYTFGASQLARFGLGQVGADRLSVGLLGRNLYTWTRFSGFDPEAGDLVTSRDNFIYPSYRTVTGSIEFTF